MARRRCAYSAVTVVTGMLVTALACLAQQTGPLVLDPGGYSVNLPDEVRAQPRLGEDLIENGSFEQLDPATDEPFGWRGAFHIFAAAHDRDRRDALREAVGDLPRREASDQDPHAGARCMRLLDPYEMQERRGGIDLNFGTYLAAEVVLPERDADTKYVLSLFTRGETRPGIPGRGRVMVAFYDQVEPRGAKTTRSSVMAYPPLDAAWTETTMDFVAPQATRRLTLFLYLDNCGEAWFDDVTLHRTTIEDGLTVRLIPMQFMDRTFCLSSGDVGMMVFAFRNELEVAVDQPRLMLELPASIEVLTTRDSTEVLSRTGVERDDEECVLYEVDVAGLARQAPKETWSGHRSLAMMVTTKLPASDARFPARYWVTDGDYQTDPLEFEVQVLPAISGERPKRFRTAAMFSSADCLYSDLPAVEALAGFYSRVGLNSAHIRPTPLGDALGRLGVARYTENYWLVNGYRLGVGQKPEGAAYTLADGTLHPRGICPTEVYTRGEYYREHVHDAILRKIIVEDRGAEHFQPNWEPYMYDWKGCFCDRCREEFVRWSELPRADVEAAWPQDIIRNYREKWAQFRSWQHGQLLRTLEEDVSALGREVGIESHFIPEVAYPMFTEEGQADDFAAQYHSRDYSQYLPVVQPWGGYCSQNLYKSYVYETGYHLKVQAVAGPVREFVDSRPEGRRPQVIGLPHSYQGDNRVTQPEAIAFDFLTYFANGWDGAMAYIFPRGYDARYWRALAGANSLIARFEDFVAPDRRDDRHTVEPTTPLPSPDPKWVEKLGSEDIVYSWEYRDGERRLFIVANFWQKGECFFRLKPTGLQDDGQYLLTEPAALRCYAGSTGQPALTAADLAGGALLHVGAMRYAFFVLEPFGEGPQPGTRVVAPAEMQTALDERLAAIQRAFEHEQELAAGREAKEAPEVVDYSGLKTVRSGDMVCRPLEVLDLAGPGISILTEDREVIIDPASGGRIVSWKTYDDELVCWDGQWSMMLDGFWYPEASAKVVVGPMQVIVQEATDQGIRVVLRRKLSDEVNDLAGLVLTKTWEIERDGMRIKLTSELTNETGGAVEFSHRYHNMPAHLELRQDQRGWAEMVRGGGPVRFERMFVKRLYEYEPAPDDELVLKGFPMDKRELIDEPVVVLDADWLPGVQLRLDPDRLLAIAFWDHGSQRCATLEPIHQRVRLDPGETWSVGATLTVAAD